MLHPLRKYNQTSNKNSLESILLYQYKSLSRCDLWTGRSCLNRLILKTNINGKVLLPCYIPEGIIQPFKVNNWEIIFYKLNNDLTTNIDHLKEIIRDNPHIFIFISINYFGFIAKNRDSVWSLLKNEKIKILDDCAHSLFNMNPYGNVKPDFILYSYNKFLPVPDGASLLSLDPNFDLAIKGEIILESNEEACEFYNNHLITNHELYTETNVASCEKLIIKTSNYYNSYYKYINNDLSFRKINKISNNILNNYDYNNLIKNRKRNANLIYKNLNSNKIKILHNIVDKDITPFCIPVIIKDITRDSIKNYSYNKNIFLLSQEEKWNFIPYERSSFFSNENFFLSNHLLIPINEFITENEINKMIEILNEYN